MSNTHNNLYEFKNFRLNVANPGLWRDGELLLVAPKILATLILLVERGGEIVSRDELLEKVWQESFVEEGNINYTISQLRKILDDRNLIQTVPKRGYRFTGEIKSVSIAQVSEPEHTETQVPISFSDTAKIEISAAKPRLRYASYFAFAAVGIFIFGLVALFSRGGTSPVQSPELTAPTDESMNAYRRGKMILDDKDVKDRAQKALDEFQKAVTLDPTSALAHAGLGKAFNRKPLPHRRAKTANFTPERTPHSKKP